MKRTNRHMAVILNEDVEDLGFAGELVDVKAGFARNFLLPTGKGVIATAKLREQRAKDISSGEAKRAKEIEDRQALAEQINNVRLQLSLKVGPGHQIFGSITARDVAKALADEKITVEPRELSGLPLKALGGHTVSAKLGLGVAAVVHLQISGEMTKAKDDKADTAKAKLAKA